MYTVTLIDRDGDMVAAYDYSEREAAELRYLRTLANLRQVVGATILVTLHEVGSPIPLRFSPTAA